MEAFKDPIFWASVLKKTRTFFDEHGFLEVMTNHVVPAGAFESTIDALKVVWKGGQGELHTSPEIQMKMVLAQHPRSLYQICRAFRDDPQSPIHLKEFTLLEFYRVGTNYRAVIEDMKALLDTLSGKALHYEEFSIDEILQKHTGLSLGELFEQNELRRAIVEHNLFEPSPHDRWPDLFFKLLLEKVEPALPQERPVILTNYPKAVSPLSQSRGPWAERFEIYWYGMELCNGCTELTDATELERRFFEQCQERHLEGKPPHPLPQTLLDALRRGLPPCAGVAVGMERLAECLKR